MRAAIVFAALVVWAGPAFAASDERLTQFQQICGEGPGSVQATLARAQAAGWAENAGAVDEQLTRLLAISQTMMLAGEDAALLVRGDAAERIYLLIASSHDAPARVGCFALAPNDRSGVPQAAVADWLRAPPTGERDLRHDGGLHMMRWDNPETFPAIYGVAVIHVPPGSAAAAQFGASGTILGMVSAPASP